MHVLSPVHRAQAACAGSITSGSSSAHAQHALTGLPPLCRLDYVGTDVAIFTGFDEEAWHAAVSVHQARAGLIQFIHPSAQAATLSLTQHPDWAAAVVQAGLCGHRCGHFHRL